MGHYIDSSIHQVDFDISVLHRIVDFNIEDFDMYSKKVRIEISV